MTDTVDTLPEPYFHDDTGALRFWVRSENAGFVGASVRKQILHYHFKSASDGTDAVQTYRAHQDLFDAAVLSRIAQGSIEPVMLREADVAGFTEGSPKQSATGKP